MTQPELDFTKSYPETAGFKEHGGTSEEAAKATQQRVTYLRAKVYQILRQSPQPLTADTVASMMGETVLSIRPRFSELHKVGRIVKTDQRGKNESGHSAIKWAAA